MRPNNLLTDPSDFVQLLQARNKAAFEQLYDQKSSVLYGLILKIVKSEQLAQDVMQDSFIKIWKHIDQYQMDKGPLLAWMIQIARRTALDVLQSKEERISNQTMDQSHIESQSMSYNIDNIDLSEKVKSLKPEHNIVIQYVYLNGYTHEEAAQLLNIPLGTLKTRVRNALQELRKIFIPL